MALAIGIDIGGTKVAAGVVDEDGRVIADRRLPTPGTSAAAVERAIADLVMELRKDHDVVAVGIGAAGFIDADRSTVLFSPNVAWRGEPLRDEVAKLVGLPVVVENDANAAAWGEYRFGAGKGETHMVCVTVGTGIGGGVVLGGQLYRGAYGIGAEFGHMQVVEDGRRCGCGQTGCWEQYCSGRALLHEAREIADVHKVYGKRLLELGDGKPEGIEAPEVTKAAIEGDPAALECFSVVGHWLGQGLANLAALLDPGAFVVGGGVADAGDLLLDPARRHFGHKLTGTGHRPRPEIRHAALGNNAGMVGAADLARPWAEPVRVVVALGGNALSPGDGTGSVEEMRGALSATAGFLASLVADGHSLVLTHGNGPQVGRLLLQQESAASVVPPMPMDVCGALSQGQLGYLVAQSLDNALRRRRLPNRVLSLVTQVVVDGRSAAFRRPSKPVGPSYERPEAQAISHASGHVFAIQPSGLWRRVVASPRPQRIVEEAPLRALVDGGHVVVAAGGGGVPVVEHRGQLVGVEAVVDKDRTAALLAVAVGADLLMVLTEAAAVQVGYGTVAARSLSTMTVAEATSYQRAGEFPTGSMGPKVEACVTFVRAGGAAAIGALSEAAAVLAGTAGTRIVA